MLNRYFSFVKNIFDGIFSGTGKNVSFLDLLQTIGLTLLIILFAAFIITVLFGSIKLPCFTYKKLTFNIKEKIASLYSSDNFSLEEVNALEGKLKKRKIGFITGLVLYIPIMFPVILYIIDLILSAF